jgi:hypothetical protein
MSPETVKARLTTAKSKKHVNYFNFNVTLKLIKLITFV